MVVNAAEDSLEFANVVVPFKPIIPTEVKLLQELNAPDIDVAADKLYAGIEDNVLQPENIDVAAVTEVVLNRLTSAKESHVENKFDTSVKDAEVVRVAFLKVIHPKNDPFKEVADRNDTLISCRDRQPDHTLVAVPVIAGNTVVGKDSSDMQLEKALDIVVTLL